MCKLYMHVVQGLLQAKFTARGRSAVAPKTGKYWWGVNQQVQRMQSSVIEQKIEEWDQALGDVILNSCESRS